MFLFSLVLFTSVLWSSAHGSSSNLLAWIAFVYAVPALLQLAGHFLVYWETDDRGLLERRFWKTTQIPWKEVTRVSPWYGRPASETLVVDFTRTPEVTPYTGRDRLIATPGDRESFIREVRRFAPQAVFDV